MDVSIPGNGRSSLRVLRESLVSRVIGRSRQRRIVVMLDVRMQLGQHEVGNLGVRPVGSVRRDGRNVRVAGLLQDVIHPVGQSLTVRQFDFLAGAWIRMCCMHVSVVRDGRRCCSGRRCRRCDAARSQVGHGVARHVGRVLHQTPNAADHLARNVADL